MPRDFIVRNDLHVVSGEIKGRLASGIVIFDSIAAGQIALYHLASGLLSSSGQITADAIASGSISSFQLASGAVNSGHISSGAVIGHAGGESFNVASGTIGTFDIGSGAIQSGRIASGQVGNFHISSGAVTSGRLGVTGSPDGTKYLRDDFTWQAVVGGGLTSGAVQSGHIGNNAVLSGNIASGQIGQYHMQSGTTVRFVSPILSGNATSIVTTEMISGIRAVALNQSGLLQIAMAGTSTRMPAIGVVVDKVTSGIQVNVFTEGIFQTTSGLADHSGYVGQRLFVGRSGNIVSASGSFNSGGLLSGDISQVIGVAINSGAFIVNNDTTLTNIGQPAGTASWGSITGTVTDQSDLTGYIQDQALIRSLIFG